MLFVCVLACVRLPSHSLRRSRDTLKLSRAERRRKTGNWEEDGEEGIEVGKEGWAPPQGCED